MKKLLVKTVFKTNLSEVDETTKTYTYFTPVELKEGELAIVESSRGLAVVLVIGMADSLPDGVDENVIKNVVGKVEFFKEEK